MDASNMLKPYVETGAIRFIGSTTYDEYNRYFCLLYTSKTGERVREEIAATRDEVKEREGEMVYCVVKVER